jgi:hypothetical protein
MRWILTQAAQAAVKKKGGHFQSVFRRLLPKLGYNGAIWAIAQRLCRLVWKILTMGSVTSSKAQKRIRRQRNGALRNSRRPCANWDTTSHSLPRSNNGTRGSEMIFNGADQPTTKSRNGAQSVSDGSPDTHQRPTSRRKSSIHKNLNPLNHEPITKGFLW